jgi:hypothetical protein
VGKVIVVGADNPHTARIMGWETADSLQDAIERAKDLTKPNPDITMTHLPPIMVCDVKPTR